MVFACANNTMDVWRNQSNLLIHWAASSKFENSRKNYIKANGSRWCIEASNTQFGGHMNKNRRIACVSTSNISTSVHAVVKWECLEKENYIQNENKKNNSIMKFYPHVNDVIFFISLSFQTWVVLCTWTNVQREFRSVEVKSQELRHSVHCAQPNKKAYKHKQYSQHLQFHGVVCNSIESTICLR